LEEQSICQLLRQFEGSALEAGARTQLPFIDVPCKLDRRIRQILHSQLSSRDHTDTDDTDSAAPGQPEPSPRDSGRTVPVGAGNSAGTVRMPGRLARGSSAMHVDTGFDQNDSPVDLKLSGLVCVLYLDGDGHLVIDDGSGVEQSIPVTRGRLVLWPNDTCIHRLDAGNNTRAMIGPMNLSSDGVWNRAGDQYAVAGEYGVDWSQHPEACRNPTSGAMYTPETPAEKAKKAKEEAAQEEAAQAERKKARETALYNKQQKKKELELDPGSWKCKLCSQLNPAANAKCRCCARPKDVILGQEKPKPTEIPLQHFRVYVSDFNQCDVTDTGSLNKEEALTLAKHQLGRHVTPEECEAWVEEMDADHDGLVTLDEYIEMVVKDRFQVYKANESMKVYDDGSSGMKTDGTFTVYENSTDALAALDEGRSCYLMQSGNSTQAS